MLKRGWPVVLRRSLRKSVILSRAKALRGYSTPQELSCFGITNWLNLRRIAGGRDEKALGALSTIAALTLLAPNTFAQGPANAAVAKTSAIVASGEPLVEFD